MRFTLGHFIMLIGIALILGPIVAPQLYDAFAAPLTLFLGIGFLGFGAMFRKVLPAQSETARPRQHRRTG